MSNENVRALSVRELVRRRSGDEPDVWHLALVQRDEVWDQVRMRYLLDSLLNGYPIGSLLVCQSTGRSSVIRVEAGQRVVTEADRDSWQLLDGQQRVNALFSVFTPNASYGHFYLNMTARRQPPSGPVTSRRRRDESLRYIQWQAELEVARAVAERDRCIDLSRWYAWAEEKGRSVVADSVSALAHGPAETVRILNAIDPDFADHLEAADLDIAWRRLRRLLDVWRERSIPVHYLALGSPLDVLEVFTRINRGGVQVAGQDLFFAAVKTLWSDAEQAMARVVDVLGPHADDQTKITPLVGRLGALRTFARLAARAARQADLVPLTVDRLSRERGGTVIDGMRRLSDPESAPLRRMAATLQAVMRSSTLGFGLYSVDQRLWDDVLGWAAVNPRVEDSAWLSEQLPSIDSYLFGATAFHYPSVLRERFSRLAMTEALAAGTAGEPFPTQRIAEVARTYIPDLQEGRQAIRGSRDVEDRLWLADHNQELFLSVLQSIPYKPQRDWFDWDHIFPQAKSSLMWSPGPDGRWRRHHQYRRFVSSAGNFWGLDAGTNRALQDLLPDEKFKLVEKWSGDGTRPIWSRECWGLTNAEIEAFREIGANLVAEADINPAMDRFHSVVTGRALRMVDEAFTRLPDAAAFAADHDVAGAEPKPEPPIADALGLEPLEEIEAAGPAFNLAVTDERVEKVLRHADEWGSGVVLRDFVQRALRLGLQVRGYQWTITITPPKTKMIALVAISPEPTQRGCSTTWVAPWAFAEHFPDIARDRCDEVLGEIRGVLLDGTQIGELAGRIEELLTVQPSAIRVPPLNKRVGPN